MIRTALRVVLAPALLLAGMAVAGAQALQPFPLPAAQTDGGKPLMEALRARKTTREFSTTQLPAQLLSNLLWAGFGVNRRNTAHRTAPSAMNAQEIDIYLATDQGVYLYDGAVHQLKPIQAGDIRAKTTGQEFGTQAPVTLIFVADYTRMVKAKPEQKQFYSGIDTGCISQNIYLFCASEGLGTVVHDLDRDLLSQAMKLRPDQKIVLAQAVGFPRK